MVFKYENKLISAEKSMAKSMFGIISKRQKEINRNQRADQGKKKKYQKSK